MVRTAATTIKVGGKSSKGAALSGGSGGGGFTTSTSRRITVGGNKLVHRPTPTWQKPITRFFDHSGDKIPEPKANGLPVLDSSVDEEDVVLKAPEWQKPVTEFFKAENETENVDMIEDDPVKDSSEEMSEDKENVSLNMESKKEKRKTSDSDNEDTQNAAEVNPPKRPKIVNYAGFQEFEDC